jgi:hypothetical protein
MNTKRQIGKIVSPNENQTFYHIHIPKCGGTSIASFFNEITDKTQSIWLDRYEHAPDIVKEFVLFNSRNGSQTTADYDRWLIRFQRQTNLNLALARIWSTHINEVKPFYIHNPFSRYIHVESLGSTFLFPIKSTFERYISYLMHFEKFNENDLNYLTPTERLRYFQIMNWPLEKLIDFSVLDNCNSFNEFSFSEISQTLTKLMNSIEKPNTFKNQVRFLRKNAIRIDQINAFLKDEVAHSGISLNVLNSGRADSRFRKLLLDDLNKRSRKILDECPDERLYNEFLG